MISVIQRVRHARVSVAGQNVGAIERGILALVAVQRDDDAHDAERILARLLAYRIFPDDQDRMNLSVRDIGGGLLLVPQFTLAADTRQGNRPSFTPAAPPEQGQYWFEYLLKRAREVYPCVASGCFGADMQVELLNDGPVTFMLATRSPIC